MRRSSIPRRKPPDGRVVLHPGYYAKSRVFPLEGGAAYEVTAKGQGGGLSLVYINENGKRLHTRFLVSPNTEGRQVSFIPPEGTHFGELIVGRGVIFIESLHIRRSTNDADVD